MQLSELKQAFDSVDVEVLEGVVKLLEPLKSITSLISGQKYVTASYIHPLCINIKQHLQQDDSDSRLIKRVKDTMMDNFEKCCTSAEDEDFLSVCTAVDPRFKDFPYFNDGQRHYVYTLLTTKLVELAELETGADGALESSHSQSDERRPHGAP